MQRALKKLGARQQGEPDTERLVNIRGGEPPLTSEEFLARTSLAGVLDTFATKSVNKVMDN
ncbi:MAG: hypothetical protein ACD_38C00165G0006 [uncultured bacterium]|uniref:Uncharacterized protein n=1 Tax=Candidatus Daviesbacteria bacterium GW2011_GWC2_40_12 TaxID=1618431 RepID=A0A0G0QNZ4_9BACT|nr:MAG: hypothetical protein ACD_38C00165G0006 [uncultured bacterium]KKQ83124.1 MAG: hypothetical protein UT04_C0038G0002 [Candidatus Daviesbacteria bacterium GW2011_GWF2_38_7]KKR17039.1 MAG: hypothetical protein UT45_C0003G0069 [Candidatus Daviesbacteria bacterium GW2011_GWA2_39_33]KKR24243.1 MAG: hypothetical protein UT54_C0025G0010 [Candidatus Daviesbacteria bacterium GW2011_GWB1_39_5]KKR42104.1 MAG: hypothetical protein UT77_C0004G0088 [Candidatus Daviesbacteria bacterium GW2011_GWC2_40_12]